MNLYLKRTAEDWIIDIAVFVVLAIFCFLCVYPFWYIVVASLNDGNDMMKGGVYIWPRVFTLDNYIGFFTQAAWQTAIQVSVARTVIGAAATTLFTSLVSYALSRRSLMFGNTYRRLFVFSMYVSGGLIPFYFILRLIGLLNSFGVYIFPTMLNLFFVIVGINFFRTIPDSLFESAWLDGASEHSIFLRVALPLSKSYLATLTLFSAVGQWNSWLDSTYYVNDKALRPMAYQMMVVINSTALSSNSNLDLTDTVRMTVTATQSTAVVATVLPILCVYPLLQKYFVQGIMIGSVKE